MRWKPTAIVNKTWDLNAKHGISENQKIIQQSLMN